MNKSMKMWLMAAILICGVSLVGCGNKKAKKEPKETQVENTPVEVKVPMQWRVLRPLRITW